MQRGEWSRSQRTTRQKCRFAVGLRERFKRGVAAAMVVMIVHSSAAYAADPTKVATSAADPTDVATSALEFGGSIGKLLWVSIQDQSTTTQGDAERYTKLASEIKAEIDLGRASSSLVRTNFNVVGTTLVYAATVDPEPVSKAVSGLAAWGAKKAGDALGQAVIEKSQQQAQAILAQGLKNSGLSAADLKTMTPAELRSRVADLEVGGEKLRDVLKDDPDSLSMLQANAADIAINIGVETLAKAEGTAADVGTIRNELGETRKQITSFQEVVSTHLDNVNTQLSGLEGATTEANQKLTALRNAVQTDSKAIQTLAQISFSGWTTSQKLQAVHSGLFPNLTPEQTTALTASLQADQTREDAVANIQLAAQDLGNLSSIAGNLGLPKEVVSDLKIAQTVATGVAQFATGNYLGAIASVTSLVGLGAPDADAQRYAAMMKYLEQQFAQVNAKLDRVIDLQVQTLKALAALADEQQKFEKAVLGQLDRVEDTVLRNERLLQALLLNQWSQCYAFINGTSLNGQFDIPNRDVLAGVVGNANIGYYSSTCYSQMVGFLDASVKPAKWSGQIIDAGSFPTDTIATDPALQKSWVAFEGQRLNAYKAARDFVLQDLTDAGGSPAAYLARFSQPVINTSYANQLDSLLATKSIHERFMSFKCNEGDVVSPALRDLLCFGIVNGAPKSPLANRWSDVLAASLIGPYSTGIIDTGITLSAIVDFANKSDQGSFVFVKPESIVNFSREGATPEMRSALSQHKGADLLGKLRWLSEAYVLQQSVTYGDYTAQLVERVLYDPTTKSLNTDPKVITDSLKQQALAAMRTNPVLARNVVMLAMRHAIADSLGGSYKAEGLEYSKTYYGLALGAFTGSQACDGSAAPRQKLTTLLPNWRFEYFVTSEQKQRDSSLNGCPTQYEPDPDTLAIQVPARGSGVGVTVGDFYVLVPSPLGLSSGLFEQADSVRLALFYRDRLNQAIIDRNVSTLVKEIAGSDNSQAIAAKTALEVLNSGWGWQNRERTK